jgi:hypothetical protein
LLIYNNVEGTTLQLSSSSTREARDLANFLLLSKLYSVIFTIIESNTAKALILQNVIALYKLTLDSAKDATKLLNSVTF